MNETRLVQIYCGGRKGETIVAIDAAVRAAGRGYRVPVVGPLKTDNSREVVGLFRVPGITVLPCGRNFGSLWNMTQIQRKTTTPYYDHCLLNVWNMALRVDRGGPYDAPVLDEAIGVCNLGFVDEASLVEAPKGKPAALGVILTGCCPLEVLRDQADYITGMVMRRHPYERGIGTREEIECQKVNIREHVLAL